MTEAEIIQGCLEGSLKHQRELYQRYAGRMMGVCMRYAGSEPEAEDILQEGFMTVFRKIDTYAGSGELGGWMRRVFTNTALMHYRKNRKRMFHADIDEVELHIQSDEDLFGTMSALDLMRMVQQLPQGARVVFNLYAIEGYDHKEIAAELDISVGTSKSQLSRARKLLRDMIELEEQKAVGNA